MTTAERASYFHQLAVFTGAGFSITKASSLMEKRWNDDHVEAAVTSLQKGINEGRTIAAALEASLRPMEHSIVEAAEKGGQLTEGFKHLEEYYQTLAVAVRKIKSAVVYPLTLGHFAVVMPTIAIASLRHVPIIPALIQNLLLLWGAIALAWFGWKWMGKASETSVVMDRLISKLPVIGKARRKFALARWATVMHFHLRSGQLISGALRSAGIASQSAWIREASNRLANCAVEGQPVTPPMMNEHAFPHELCAHLRAGEETGTLDTESGRQARLLMEEATFATGIVAEWLPRCIYVIFAILAVYQIFAVVQEYGAGLTRVFGGKDF